MTRNSREKVYIHTRCNTNKGWSHSGPKSAFHPRTITCVARVGTAKGSVLIVTAFEERIIICMLITLASS